MPDASPATVVRASSRWRPLLWFWLAVLALTATGGAVLHRLAPPPERSGGGPSRPVPRHPAEAGAPAPPAAASVLPAAVPPARPEPGERQPGEQPTRPALSERADGADEPVGAGRDDGRVLVTLHPATGSGDGAALAERLATRAGIAPDRIGAGTESGLGRGAAVIRFYAARDHALARRLGQELAGMGYKWRIENLSDQPSPPGRQAVEVWLPERR